MCRDHFTYEINHQLSALNFWIERVRTSHGVSCQLLSTDSTTDGAVINVYNTLSKSLLSPSSMRENVRHVASDTAPILPPQSGTDQNCNVRAGKRSMNLDTVRSESESFSGTLQSAGSI